MKEQGLQKIHQKAEAAVGQALAADAGQKGLNDLHFTMGGIDAVHSIVTNLNAALIVRLQLVRDNHEYLAAGFSRFDDFMDGFPGSPMSYKRFNYLENIFKDLGAEVFDLATSAGLSARQQKLLRKGSIEVADGKVFIQFEGEVVEEIEITNRRRLLQALKALADANADRSIKIERQAVTIEKQRVTIQNAHDDYDKLRASKIADVASHPHMMARLDLGLAFRRLTEAAAALKAVERDQFRDKVLEDVAAWRSSLAAAYATGRSAQPHTAVVAGSDFGEALDNFLEQDFNNDHELASRL
jgi:hypothetical protein